MKLLFCKNCYDIVKLQLLKTRKCKCGACSGKYINEKTVEYRGLDAVILSINDADIRSLAQNYTDTIPLYKSNKNLIDKTDCHINYREARLGMFENKL